MNAGNWLLRGAQSMRGLNFKRGDVAAKVSSKSANMRNAASAAAAGFRPCKRCSPQGASPAEQLDALVKIGISGQASRIKNGSNWTKCALWRKNIQATAAARPIHSTHWLMRDQFGPDGGPFPCSCD